jgi:hypothetical protein
MSFVLLGLGLASVVVAHMARRQRTVAKPARRRAIRACVLLLAVVTTIAVVAVLGTSPSRTETQVGRLVLALAALAAVSVSSFGESLERDRD